MITQPTGALCLYTSLMENSQLSEQYKIRGAISCFQKKGSYKLLTTQIIIYRILDVYQHKHDYETYSKLFILLQPIPIPWMPWVSKTTNIPMLQCILHLFPNCLQNKDFPEN